MIVGFTCGSFDLLHAGHAMMLEEARSHCDRLVVGLQTDPTLDRPEKNKPIMDLAERRVMLQAVRWVDEIREYSTEAELVGLLRALKPDVRIVGADWKGKPFTGFALPIRVVFNTRDHGYSTSSLRERVFHAELEKRVTPSLAPYADSIKRALGNK